MNGGRAQEILLLAGSGKKKSETSKTVDDFAFPRRLDDALAGSHRLDGVDESREHRRLRDGDIVRSQNQFQLRGQRRETLYGSNVGIEIGLRPKEPDRGGIVRVARKKQSVFAVEQRNRVRRVARRGNHFQRAATEIYFKAIMDEVRQFPGFCRMRSWIETLWQIAAKLIRCNFRLRIFARTFRIRPREIGVHAVDESELPVAAHVIVMRMRVEHHYPTRSKFRRDFANVADAHAGVYQHGLLVANNQV